MTCRGRSFLNCIRNLVVRTGSLPPFYSLYKSLYWLSFRIVCYSFRRDRDMLCLISTEASDERWLPGISDIDVIALVRSSALQASSSLTARLRLRHRILRAFLPHFSDFEIVDEESFKVLGRSVFGPMSTAKTYRIENFRASKSLMARLEPACRGGKEQFSAADHLRNAILRYINFHIPNSSLASQELCYWERVNRRHLNDKFCDLMLQCQIPTEEASPPLHLGSPSGSLLEASLLRLEHSAVSHLKADPPTTRPLGPATGSDQRLAPTLRQIELFLNRLGPDRLDVVVWRESHLGGRSTMAFVLPLSQGKIEHGALEGLQRFLLDIRLDPNLFTVNPHQWTHSAPYPLIFTASSWRSWLRCYPLNAYYLSRAKSVVFATERLRVLCPRQIDLVSFARVQLGVWSTNRNGFDGRSSERARRYLLEVAELARLTEGLIKGQDPLIDEDFSLPPLCLGQADHLCAERLRTLALAVASAS